MATEASRQPDISPVHGSGFPATSRFWPDRIRYRQPMECHLKGADSCVTLQSPGSSGVEQWTENPRVGGSIPPPGTTFVKSIDENQGYGVRVPWFIHSLIPQDHKTLQIFAFTRSGSTLSRANVHPCCTLDVPLRLAEIALRMDKQSDSKSFETKENRWWHFK